MRPNFRRPAPAGPPPESRPGLLRRFAPSGLNPFGGLKPFNRNSWSRPAASSTAATAKPIVPATPTAPARAVPATTAAPPPPPPRAVPATTAAPPPPPPRPAPPMRSALDRTAAFLKDKAAKMTADIKAHSAKGMENLRAGMEAEDEYGDLVEAWNKILDKSNKFNPDGGHDSAAAPAASGATVNYTPEQAQREKQKTAIRVNELQLLKANKATALGADTLQEIDHAIAAAQAAVAHVDETVKLFQAASESDWGTRPMAGSSQADLNKVVADLVGDEEVLALFVEFLNMLGPKAPS